jgi:uncharacterized membrane protein
MARDVLYLLGLMIVGYALAGFYIVRLRMERKRLARKEEGVQSLEAFREKYLKGDISLDEYEDAVRRYEALRKEE